jgi:hypothetical protein
MEAIDIAAAIFLVISMTFGIMLGLQIKRNVILSENLVELSRYTDEYKKETESLKKENWKMLQAIGENDTNRLVEYRLLYETHKDLDRATWFGDRSSNGNGIISKMEQHEKEV